MMEIVSETDFAPVASGFVPNYFVDITSFIEKKIRIMRLYKGQMKRPPFPRSERTLRALAAYRGAAAGCLYAESFRIVKEIG